MFNRSHKLGLLKDYDLDEIITTLTRKMILEMTMEDTRFINPKPPFFISFPLVDTKTLNTEPPGAKIHFLGT